MPDANTTILNLPRMARRAGVTQSWLRRAAVAGQIPCLQADGRLLFSVKAVEAKLAELASAPVRTPNRRIGDST